MANITNYLADKLIDHANGKAAYTMPTEVYIGMLKTASTASTPGTEVTTTDVPGYTRIAVPAADLNSASAGSTASNAQINGVTAGAGGTSPTVADWGIYDAATGGNQLWFGTLSPSFVYSSGVQPQCPAGNISMSLT